ncbi:MAG: HNH endonuclease domain-containing protein [Paludibacter sp.]
MVSIAGISNRGLLRVFTLNVPYRFLSPWINYTTDNQVVELSQSYTNNCIYSIKDDTIEINPKWEQYLNDNYLILRDYTFWNLTVFLQKRNPNVPDVPSKLVKPILRDSLLKQRHFWDTFIDLNGSMKCIYTGKELYKKSYDLDHFVPWSFVSHNLLWNLLPADSGINSSKSNNLPLLNEYLRPFAKMHQQAIQVIYPKNPNNKLLEDYLTLHDSLSDLVQLSDNEFLNVFQKTFSPMVQIAENMGFKYWQKSLLL